MLALHIGKGFVPFLLALVLPGRRGCVGVGVGREVLANAHRDIDRERERESVYSRGKPSTCG